MSIKPIILLFALSIGCCFQHAFAQSRQPEYKSLPGTNKFSFSAQTGYGITSSNQEGAGNNEPLNGITVAFSLGYRFSENFSLEAGPAFWLAANDVFASNAAGKAKPVDKRTLVTLSGQFRISSRFPLTFRLGAGAGSLVFTPEKNTISTDEQKYGKTEIISGLGGIAGFSFPFQLSPKTDLVTGMNCWYLDLQEPEISYASAVDWSKPSVTAEIFLKLRYNF